MDANARIGSTLSPYIGRCEIDVENDNGARLRGFAETFHLKVVKSFFLAGYTWRSPKGAERSVDYGLLDDDCWGWVQGARVVGDIVLSTCT